MALKNELSVNLGLPTATSVQDPELALEFNRLYNAVKLLARTLDLNTGALSEESTYWDQAGVSRYKFGNNSKIYLEAGEDLDYGSLVGIKNDGKAWKADDGVLRCVGFCSVTTGTLTGEFTEFQVFGVYPPFPAATLTPGNFYYLSSTAGELGAAGTGPTWNQVIGFAVSDTSLIFMPQL